MYTIAKPIKGGSIVEVDLEYFDNETLEKYILEFKDDIKKDTFEYENSIKNFTNNFLFERSISHKNGFINEIKRIIRKRKLQQIINKYEI